MLSSSAIVLRSAESVKELSFENDGGTYHHSMRAQGGAQRVGLHAQLDVAPDSEG